MSSVMITSCHQSSIFDQGITRASAAGSVLGEDALLHEIVDVAQRGVLRTFLDLRPLGGCQIALEPIKQAVEHVTLPVVQGCTGVLLPEASLLQNMRECLFGTVKSAPEAV